MCREYIESAEADGQAPDLTILGPVTEIFERLEC
jgi:hypothetical protein